MIKWFRKLYYWKRRKKLQQEIEEIVSNTASREVYDRLYGAHSLRSTKRLHCPDYPYHFSHNGKMIEQNCHCGELKCYHGHTSKLLE